MSWLSRLKIQMDNVEGERNTVRFFDIEWEELDRIIAIVEEAEVSNFEDSRGNMRCPICSATEGDEGHSFTCPYSDEWVKP